MLHRFIAAASLLIALLSTLCWAFEIPVEKTTLANGLTVLISPDTSANTASVYTFVNAGSRDEDRSGITGLAHVFEHMMFRGTAKFPSYSGAAAPLGAETNGWTTNDYTAYFINAEAQFLEKMIELESDRIINLNFTNETFRTELGPVKEERRRGVADDPEGFLEVEIYRLAFSVHTYSHPVIGWEEDLETKMTFEDGLQFKNRFYVPNNCLLVITGNVDVAKTQELVEQYYSGWPRADAYAPQIVAEPASIQEKSRDFVWKDDEVTPLLWVAYRTPAAKLDLKAHVALEIINEALFSRSGRLTKLLRDQLGLVESVGASYDLSKDPSLLQIRARLRRGASLTEVRDSISSALKLLTVEPIPSAELERIQNNLRARTVFALERPARIAGSIGINELLLGSYRAMFEVHDLYREVTPEKIRATALDVFTPINRNVVTLLPKSGI